MADQPQPDFSQNQQYAPGFQAQQPIPGISSSFNQPQQYQPQFQTNPLVAQQADMIAVQSMVNSRTTMQLAQQNLMNSMHFALAGTMGAFTDVSRRGSSMITAMAPVGKYNDMLAPNQNWALESSFRRETGFWLSNKMGLDPNNSVLSRMIQGRRPEFLTEGEYTSTMGLASELRTASLTKGFQSIAGSAGLTMGASALGLGLAGSIALPMVGGLLLDRHLEAVHAEHEDLLRTQMKTKNKRVGIGQQFISQEATKSMHGVFYGQENPYAARFLGDNALGNAFKPDVQKLKIFNQASDNGLLAFENLDADGLIKQINKISETVEKFSRIGKVTREASIKLMGELKSSGIHGDQLHKDFGHAAITSSITGIDLESLVGMKAQAARQGSYMGFDTFSSSRNAENVLSGYAMMQANGLFQQKDISRLTQIRNQENVGGGNKDYWDNYLRFGGDTNRMKEFYRNRGNGNLAQGLENQDLANMPVIDHATAIVDVAWRKRGKDIGWNEVSKSGAFMEHPELKATSLAYFLGMNNLSQDQVYRDAARRKNIAVEDYRSLRDFGADPSYDTANAYFGRTQLDQHKRDKRTSFTLVKSDLDSIRSTIGEGYWGDKIRNIKVSANPTMEEAEAATQQLFSILPINAKGKFEDNVENVLDRRWTNSVLGDDTGRSRTELSLLALEALNPAAYKAIEGRVRKHEKFNTKFGYVLEVFDRNMDGRKTSNRSNEKGLEFLKGLSPEQRQFFESKILPSIFNDPKNLKSSIDGVVEALKSQGIDTSVFETGPMTNQENVQDRFYSVLSHMNENKRAFDAATYRQEMGLAKRAGLTLSDYRKAFSPFLEFADKYQVDAKGQVGADYKVKEDPNEPTKDVKSSLIQLLTSKDDKVQKYIKASLSGVNVPGLIKSLEEGTPLNGNGNLDAIIKNLTQQANSVSDDIKKGLTTEDLSKVIDPSTAAITTMNDILAKIYVQMGGKETPKQVEAKK